MRDPAGWLVFSSLAIAGLAVLWLTAAGLGADYRAWQTARRARPLRLRVDERAELSDEAFTITLRCVGRWRKLPAFRPGQHVVLQVPAGDDRTVLRAYSIAAWRAQPNRYELGIKREAEGQISRWLHEHAKSGLVLNVGAPKGAFHAPCVPTIDQIVLVAGGIGITPMRAMLHFWRQTPAPPRVALHFSARTSAQLYFHDEFVELTRVAPWFEYRPRLTQPPADWSGETGRLTAANIMTSIADTGRAQVFMCAVPAMEDAIVEGLTAAGLDPQCLHRESFGLQVGRNDVQAEVTFEGRRFAYDGAPTLLHALLAQDFDIPAECRAGECGRCRLSIVRGAARDLLTGREECESVLTCCGVPTSDLELAR